MRSTETGDTSTETQKVSPVSTDVREHRDTGRNLEMAWNIRWWPSRRQPWGE